MAASRSYGAILIQSVKKQWLTGAAALIALGLFGTASADAATVVYKNGTATPFVGGTYAGEQDTMLASNGGGTSSFGARTGIQIGAAGALVDHGLLRFNLTSMAGQYSSINSVTIGLTLSSTVGVGASAYSETLQIYAVSAANSDWVEGSSSSPATDGSSTWKYKSQTSTTTGTSWAGAAGANTMGTDYDSLLLASYTYDNTAATRGYITLTLPASLIESWIGGNTAGLFLRTATDVNTGGLDQRIEILTNGTNLPSLIIDYAAIPEPSSNALMMLGLGVLCFVGFKRLRFSR